MESQTCGQCTRSTYDLCVARAQLQQQYEELCILRKAQRECADMASEIQALHNCVEEQRRHLQAQSSKPKDPGVGIFAWMDAVSKQHQQREADLRATYEEQVQALQVLHHTSVQQVAYLSAQVTTLTATLDAAKEASVTQAKELEMAYQCITEQRRHIHSVETDGASADADVGLLPLLRAGVASLQEEHPPAALPPDVLTRAQLCFTLAIDATEAEVSKLTREKEALQCELAAAQAELTTCRQQVSDVTREKETLQHKLTAADTSMQGLACENVGLTAQLSMLNEAFTALQLEKASIEELERVQSGFEELATANEKLQIDVSRLTRERDATVKGIRHWQGEAQKITADLVAALESRDRYQAEQFTALKQCRQLTERVTGLERQVADMFKFHQLGQQVFGLVQVVDRAIVTESIHVGGGADDGVVTAAAADGEGKKKAKGKKKKNSKA